MNAVENFTTKVIPESMRAYLRMKTSLDQFGKIASELNDKEQKQLNQVMTQALKIYSAVLGSIESTKVIVPESQVKSSMKVLRSRFNNEQDFETVLEANNLDEETLLLSLRKELHCETTLDYASNGCEPMSDNDAEDYYYQNLAKFSQPERRKASHILITVNDDFDENTHENAHKRMNEIASEITSSTFGLFAIRYSECPTAVNEGNLGLVTKGQLHAELDDYLFSMESNAVSTVIETEIGVHLLWCESVTPVHTVSFKQAKEQIIEQHLAVLRKRKQKAWIASLFNKVDA